MAVEGGVLHWCYHRRSVKCWWSGGHDLWGFVRGDVKFGGRVLVSGELLTDSFG